jgi:hypothetical protein
MCCSMESWQGVCEYVDLPMVISQDGIPVHWMVKISRFGGDTLNQVKVQHWCM